MPTRSGLRWVRDDGLAWVTAALFWMVFVLNRPGNLDGVAQKMDAGFGAANPIDRVIKLTMLGVSLLLIGNRLKLLREFRRYVNPGLQAFFVLAFASTAWSIAPSNTIMRCIAMTTTLLVCVSFVLVSWHPRRFQLVIGPPLLIIMIGSLVLGMVAHNLVVEAADTIALKDAWHGISHSKNEFGMLSSMGVIVFTHGWLTRAWRPTVALSAAAACFFCLTLSRSNTSLLATLVALGVMFLLMRVPAIEKRHTNKIVITITIVIIIYEMTIQNVIPGVETLLGPITAMMGKDTTFSARTTIWGIIKEHIKLSPWIGTGIGGYWIGPLPSSPSYIFLAVMWLYPTESHNGYLEIVNDLGYLGLTVLGLFFFYYVRQALQLMRVDRGQASLCLGLLFMEMIVNMSESDWFSNSNTFAILMLATLSMSRTLLDADLRGLPEQARDESGQTCRS